MSNLLEQIAKLSPEKRELLLQRLSKKRGNVSPAAIKPQSRESNCFPLSYAQERLWFLYQLEPDSSAYNLSAAYRLTGLLNPAVLQQSLNEIIRRHEVLRTTFITAQGQPLQCIAPNLTLTLPVVDLRELSTSQQNAEVQRLAIEEAQRPFDLAHEPLLRGTLLQLETQEYVVLFTMHHIISDGWPAGVLIRELVALYAALPAGKPASLPELPIQYADFSVWQRQWLQQEKTLQQQLAYWQQQLAGSLPVLQLPTDRPRPAVQTARGAMRSHILPQSLTAALKGFSQQAGVTLFMTLLAAFKLLLYRYTQQDDIVVGTPIANRNRSEIEGLIGFFVNTLVLRTHLAGNLSFCELLKRVQEVALGAYAHQDLPFELLVKELQPERNLSRNPLFQVMFVLQNAPKAGLKLPGLTLTPLKIDRQAANFDLTLTMVDTEQGLRGSIEYNLDLFDATTIDRMWGHFQTLLAGIVANPHQCLSNLPLLTITEQQQLLQEWNQTSCLPPSECIHQQFEAQVEQTPEAVAVVFTDEETLQIKSLNYQELNAKANQLAHYLRSQGIKPNELVGLCVERSLDMVIGLLGILKAGAAYVPLDPAYPPERLALMVADAKVSVLLTQQQLLARLPQSAPVVCLDTDWQAIATAPEHNPINQTTPAHLAYVIYTSGTTGKPKGVMIQHQSLVAYTETAANTYGVTASDRILQFASISFDAAAEEIFPCLIAGATLVLRTEEMLSSVPGFLQTCSDWSITVLDLPTAFWHQIAAELTTPGLILPESLRLLIIGGESALAEHIATWQQQIDPGIRLMNSYGPTETTIVATMCDLSTTKVVDSVPIGRAIRNIQTYVLDPDLQPVPIGIPGELYIGGIGVALGYLNQPLLTAEKFIPNLFSNKPGTRLYKTGDLVRYRHSGELEFLGRIDHQVKIRGFRIELGEIETAIAQYPVVQEAVVIAHEDNLKQKRLIAYLIPNQHHTFVASELQRFLQAKLPSYMIPANFVCLESLPLTPNRKVDRSSLPAPDLTTQSQTTTTVSPRTPTEKKLVQIWAEILSLQQVSIHDDFFSLGGHSLLMTQLLTRVRDTFQVDLSLRSLFAAPTIAKLAETIENVGQFKDSPPSEQKPEIDWQAEAVLDSTIFPEVIPFVFPLKPANIFLTGATGFLGAFLLFELLQQSQAEIYCLVRAANLELGKQRLRHSLESYLLWNPDFQNRIIPVIGDLSQPYFGLSPSQFQQLARQLDVIYHNGAWVHHIYPYSVLKQANVLGTQEVLRLASQIKTKPIHFISTTSVFSSTTDSDVKLVREQDRLESSNISNNGYVQSKWVAEKLLNIAAARGIPISIYRPGRISGHSKTGVFNPNDFLYRLIIGCIHLGSAPDKDITEDIIPVDYVSRAIIHLSRKETCLGKAFHLVNSHPLQSRQLLDLIRSFGYPIQQIPYHAWRTKLIAIAGHSPNHPLYPLVPFFPARSADDKSSSAALQFDCQQTRDGLADSSIVCPPVDQSLLKTYLSSMIQSGCLQPF